MNTRMNAIAAVLLTFTVHFAGCGGDNGGGAGDGDGGGYVAGESLTHTIAHTPLSWVMVYVPGKTFPSERDDTGTATVSGNFWIGETEVTYELWKSVYDMAGGPGYTFKNAGVKGNDGDAGKSGLHPATTVSWRDAIVFCNALTEWYNSYNETNLVCAYTYGGAIIKDATNATACDNAVYDPVADGFRLPTSDEWELAARWRSDAANTVSGYTNPYFTKGDSASGAAGNYADDAACGLVAVYNASATAEVKSKAVNSLGIYDMSGNVTEWCFDIFSLSPGTRVTKGGHWNTDATSLQIGNRLSSGSARVNGHLGFRIVKSAL